MPDSDNAIHTPTLAPPSQPKRKRRRWTWVVIAAILVVAGAWFFLRPQSTAQSAPKQARGRGRTFVPAGGLQIATVTAKKGDIGVYVAALGTVTPLNTVTVTSRVTGQITSVNYIEGQMVHKGDPLIDIDPRPYQAALTQVQGQLAHDQAVLNEARIDLTRYQAAFARNAIPKQQLDDQNEVVHQDEGTVQNDEGQVANANVNLAYTHITSPIEGRVGLRLVDVGNIVQAGSTNPLVVITQLQPITVIFSVAEDYLPQIQAQLRTGRPMEVDAFDRSQETKIATGSVFTLDNEIDTSTGTIKIKSLFPNKDNSLFPNQFVNARLQINTEHGVTIVPSSTIQRNAQSAYVYVVQQDQTVAMKSVTVGVTDGNNSAVQGINPGDVVAADNFDKLQPGIKVASKAGSGSASDNGSQTAGE